MSLNYQPPVSQDQFTWAIKEYDTKLQSLKSELEKTNKEKNEMLLSLLSELAIITESSIKKNSEKQDNRINTLESRVKELEDEVKYLKTLPQGLMETLGYKKI
jgi:predicted RNase H-like nuclease (RuvC/YqgF family)